MSTTWLIETSDAINDGGGWSASGCWVDRQEITIPDDLTERQIICRLRKAAGLNGSRAITESYAEGYAWKHPGAAILTFAMPYY